MNFHQVGFCLCDTVQWRGSNKRRRFVRVVQLVVKITLGGCFHGGWTDIRGLMKLPSVHPALTLECFRGYIQCTPHLRTYEAIFSAPCSGIWGPSKLSLVQMNWHSSASVAVFTSVRCFILVFVTSLGWLSSVQMKWWHLRSYYHCAESTSVKFVNLVLKSCTAAEI